jgi:hypothetical protein
MALSNHVLTSSLRVAFLYFLTQSLANARGVLERVCRMTPTLGDLLGVSCEEVEAAWDVLGAGPTAEVFAKANAAGRDGVGVGGVGDGSGGSGNGGSGGSGNGVGNGGVGGGTAMEPRSSGSSLASSLAHRRAQPRVSSQRPSRKWSAASSDSLSQIPAGRAGSFDESAEDAGGGGSSGSGGGVSGTRAEAVALAEHAHHMTPIELKVMLAFACHTLVGSRAHDKDGQHSLRTSLLKTLGRKVALGVVTKEEAQHMARTCGLDISLDEVMGGEGGGEEDSPDDYASGMVGRPAGDSAAGRGGGGGGGGSGGGGGDGGGGTPRSSSGDRSGSSGGRGGSLQKWRAAARPAVVSPRHAALFGPSVDDDSVGSGGGGGGGGGGSRGNVGRVGQLLRSVASTPDVTAAVVTADDSEYADSHSWVDRSAGGGGYGNTGAGSAASGDAAASLDTVRVAVGCCGWQRLRAVGRTIWGGGCKKAQVGDRTMVCNGHLATVGRSLLGPGPSLMCFCAAYSGPGLVVLLCRSPPVCTVLSPSLSRVATTRCGTSASSLRWAQRFSMDSLFNVLSMFADGTADTNPRLAFGYAWVRKLTTAARGRVPLLWRG